jgi:preprotein translocase subunit YajC
LSTGTLYQLLPVVVLLGLMYFMMIRPQQQQAKKRTEMLNSLRAGVEIVTIGGLHGTIESMDDKTVYLKVASGVVLKFNRSAIGAVRENKQ